MYPVCMCLHVYLHMILKKETRKEYQHQLRLLKWGEGQTAL